MSDMIDAINLEIGERIKKIRNSKGWTQKQLAMKAGITIQSVLYVEKGKRGLSSHTMRSISSALEVTADYLLFGHSGSLSEIEIAAMMPAGLSEEELSNSVETMNKVAEILRRYKEVLRDAGVNPENDERSGDTEIELRSGEYA